MLLLTSHLIYAHVSVRLFESFICIYKYLKSPHLVQKNEDNNGKKWTKTAKNGAQSLIKCPNAHVKHLLSYPTPPYSIFAFLHPSYVPMWGIW